VEVIRETTWDLPEERKKVAEEIVVRQGRQIKLKRGIE